MAQAFEYITYGSTCTPIELEGFLQHVVNHHFQSTSTAIPTPICIWGTHGIGKTEIVQVLAGRLGAHLAYIAPAQFEEMGDLLGLPTADKAGGYTTYLPPEWAPRQPGPGILLIDDVNRADERILRGIMQLLQQHALVSWQLPPRWQIILTANPDGGDYAVTSMDDAMLSRMLHVTLRFDVKSWARWAEANSIDPRGINFVLAYPELVTGGRTTPRSLVQFFEQLKSVSDAKAQLPLVKMLAEATLDDAATSAFISFVQLQLHHIIGPEEWLECADFDGLLHRFTTATVEDGRHRVDLMAVTLTRLTNYLEHFSDELSPAQFDRLRRLLLLDTIPNDLRFITAQALAGAKNPSFQTLLSDPAIGKLLLG